MKNQTKNNRCEKCNKPMALIFGSNTFFCVNKDCDYFELLPKGIKKLTKETEKLKEKWWFGGVVDGKRVMGDIIMEWAGKHKIDYGLKEVVSLTELEKFINSKQ